MQSIKSMRKIWSSLGRKESRKRIRWSKREKDKILSMNMKGTNGVRRLSEMLKFAVQSRLRNTRAKMRGKRSQQT